MTGCTGRCKALKASKPVTGGRYAAGQKRCDTCHGIFILTDKIKCPCCDIRLRYKPRNPNKKTDNRI